MVKALRECPLPVIAAVNGIAAGAGSVIALACDFRLLAESASFAFLFTRVGLAGADMGSAYLLPRIVGLGRATELLMLGDKLDAAAGATRSGWRREVVAGRGARRRSARRWPTRLATGPAFAYSPPSRCSPASSTWTSAARSSSRRSTQALMMKSEDFAEFYAAWSEGRKPDWRGR